MTQDDLKICIDLSGQFEQRLFGLYNSYNERKENLLTEDYKRIIGSDTITEQILLDSKKFRNFDKLSTASNDKRERLIELAMVRKKLWENGKHLKVKFLEGTNYLHQQVISNAKEWEKYAHITFDFIDFGNAEIRIAFQKGKGSWSAVGVDALCISDQNQPTMNFGWFDNSTPAYEFSRTIIHEFGHCLGCIHEHQNPSANIDWNKQVVYDYYQKTQGWTREEIDRNIFEKFSQKELTNSKYDSQSIMHYPIPREHLNSGTPVGWNSVLTWNDIEFVSSKYPKP